MKKIIALLVLLVSVFSLFSCGRDITPKNRVYYEYFDTLCTVYDYTGMDDTRFETMLSDVEAMMKKYHELFDIYHLYDGVTNLAAINASEGKVKVTRELFDFLLFAKEMYALTDGEVNIAFGSVLSIWHSYREEGKSVPEKEMLEDANAHTNIDDLILSEENMTVERRDTGLLLDAGALGKGYACEVIGEYIREKYGEGIVLDFGGNLKAIGSKPNGGGWKTGIRNPDELSSTLFVTTFDISDECVATSGNYERYYYVDGVRYHHVIDKDTLMPSDLYASVSVVYTSGAICDALSTAFFNTGRDVIEDIAKNFDGMRVILVYPDGKLEIIK